MSGMKMQRAHLCVVNVEAIVAVELAVKVFHFTLYLARVLAKADTVSSVAHYRVGVNDCGGGG